MIYKLLADIAVLVHLLWILFLIGGAYWGRKYRAVKYLQGAGIAFALISQWFGWYCPLTHLEVWLRQQHAPALAYPGSFIAHYAERLVYFDISPPIIFALTAALAGINAWWYQHPAPNKKE